MGRRTESEVQSPRSKVRSPTFRVFRGKPEALELGSVEAWERSLGNTGHSTFNIQHRITNSDKNASRHPSLTSRVRASSHPVIH